MFMFPKIMFKYILLLEFGMLSHGGQDMLIAVVGKLET